MRKRYSLQALYAIVAGCLFLIQIACVKENFTQTTDETANISTFLSKSEDYNLFHEALRLSGVASYLDAWGTYTVFAPNNVAMRNYLQGQGKQSVAELDEAQLKLMVNQHIVADTVSTGNFVDGKIAKNSVADLFITTSVANEGGQARIVLNKEAVIILPNQRLGNGIVHGIDKVFSPITRTLMEEIKANPELSLFVAAMEATGLDAVLNTVAPDKYFSVLAITDAVFAQRGFNSLQDLKDEYSNTGNPKNPDDGLYKHMGYHIVNDLKYVSDLMRQNSHTTRVPNEIIIVKVDRERVLINEEEWLGNIELGAEVDRANSDNTTRNGVLHYLKDNIFIKERIPFPIYWDPAKQPEIETAGAYGRSNLTIAKGFLKDVTWGGAESTTISYENPTTGNMGGAVYNDLLVANIRTAVIPWIEFKTPIIVRGRYRVWVAYRTIQDGQQLGNIIDVYFNGEKLSRPINQGEYRNRTLSPRELEALGYKMHISGSPSGANNYNTKMVGIIDVDVTDRHILRFETLTNRGTNNGFRIDMIHFIPIDQEQIYPVFDVAGNPVWP